MDKFLNSTQQTVEWFRDNADKGRLEMRPPFQRKLVWLLPQKSYLIDSILHGYPIPEIYLQSYQDDEGRTTWVVVDGQQRITTCLEFLERKFELTGDDVSADWRDLTYDDLNPTLKRRVTGYNFVVRMLPEMSETEIREIFRRLNSNNVALNAQELRHARFLGDFIRFIEAQSDLAFWVNSGVFSANDFRRMLDREYISELAVGVLHGPQNKKLSLDKWYAVYEEQFEERTLLEEKFELVTGEIRQVFPDLRKHRWVKKSDFYSLFLALSQNSTNLPLARDARELLRHRLEVFGQEVTSFLALKKVQSVDGIGEEDEAGSEEEISSPPPRDFSGNVARYGEAVERAASDLSRRRTRISIIDAIIGEALVFGVL